MLSWLLRSAKLYQILLTSEQYNSQVYGRKADSVSLTPSSITVRTSGGAPLLAVSRHQFVRHDSILWTLLFLVVPSTAVISIPLHLLHR